MGGGVFCFLFLPPTKLQFFSFEGASETGPITPIKNVKAGYHDWRYLSPRTDLGLGSFPRITATTMKRMGRTRTRTEKSKGGCICSSFGLRGIIAQVNLQQCFWPYLNKS